MIEPSAEHFLSMIRTRRSLRRYDSQPVPKSLIETILEAGTWSPSAHNRQPWRFAVLQSFPQKQQLALKMGERLRADLEKDLVPQNVIDVDVSRSYERLTLAPVVIVMSLSMSDMDQYRDSQRALQEWTMAVQSVAMAGQTILLAAHIHGLGACWMCAPLFCPDVVQQTLNLPDDWQPQGIITMGYPAQSREKTRAPLETRTLWLD